MSHAREVKQQHDAPDADADVRDIDEYIEYAQSRKREEHAHGARMIYKLIASHQLPTDEHVDKILDICAGCLEHSRDTEEREQLVAIAANLIMAGTVTGEFIAEFAENLAKELPNVLEDLDKVKLAQTMIHAIVVAQAMEGNSIKVKGELLSTRLLQQKPPHDGSGELALAYTRLLAVTADQEEHAEPLAAVIRHQLQVHGSDPVIATGLVKCVALAIEAHGEANGLNVHVLAPLEDAGAKAPGSKDAKKELASTIRTVEAYIRNGDFPHQTITLQMAHTRNEQVDVPIETFQQLAWLESVRRLSGDQYYQNMLCSPALAQLFNIDIPEDEASVRRYIRGQQQLETRYDRIKETRQRNKGRSRARDMKRHASAGDYSE